jgi:hypothetical protein
LTAFFSVFQLFKSRPGTILCAICFAGGTVWILLTKPALPVLPEKSGAKPAGNSFGDFVEHTKPASDFPPAENPVFRAPLATDSEEDLLALARAAFTRSPQKAMAWAQSQTDPDLRQRVLSAVIRAWGESDPDAAVDWVLVQDDSERRMDMEAALAGAVKQPQLALAIVRGLLKYDPDDEAGAGPALVVALNNAGQFQTALEFINAGPPDSQADWTTATFHRWGGNQPPDAIKALDSIADEKLRNAAFQAIADGWSDSDPSALANYATTLLDAKDRTYALNKAIDNWSLQDPAAMADWLTTSPSGVDFDQAIATLISKTDGVNRSPEVAMQWVENISDPNLKYDSMKLVLGQWNQTAPAAAQNYAANVSWLDEPKRQELLKSLQSPPPDVAVGDNE